MKVQRALISVFNKSGVESFAKGLTDLGVQVISTGGTARLLKDSGIPVTLVEEVTGFPEMLDGRVKTMHPRSWPASWPTARVPEHMDTIKEHGIEPIDMVVCSLYPFEEVAGRRGVTDEVVIENIDIGGPSMIRAAAKNHAGVAVVTSHDDYAAAAGRAARDGRARLPHASRARHQGLPPHRALRLRHRQLVQRGGGRLPQLRDARLPEGHGAQVRREPAPAGRLLRRGGAAPAPPVAGHAAARQAARLQQPVRPQRGAHHLRRVHAALRRHRQAQQPVRLRSGRESRGRLRQGLRLRSAQRLRLGHRRQPRRRRAAGRAPQGALRRGAVRAGLRGRGAGHPHARRRTSASSRTTSAAR